MHFKFLLVFTILLVQLKYIYSYPDGAPLAKCESMLPGHGVEPINSKPPFEVTYVYNNVTGGFDVTIGSLESTLFKGFLLEARGKWDGTAIGKWSTHVPNTKTIDCFELANSAVTHNWHDDSTNLGEHKFHEVTFSWVPPVSKKLNRVKFIATVVQSYKKIYLNVSTTMNLRSYKKVKLN